MPWSKLTTESTHTDPSRLYLQLSIFQLKVIDFCYRHNFPLHYAVVSKSLDCVKALVEKSQQIEIDCRNNDNMTPLFIA